MMMTSICSGAAMATLTVAMFFIAFCDDTYLNRNKVVTFVTLAWLWLVIGTLSVLWGTL
jgi:hypothetical protein